MPAKDRYHDSVKQALQRDGWTIDEEQVTLTIEKRNLWVDLQASKTEPYLVILVEVKELAEVESAVEALANALGKIELYRIAMVEAGLRHPLFLAVTYDAYAGILSESIGQRALERAQIPLLIFDPILEEVIKWIP